MQEAFVIDGKEFAGRKIVIDVPPIPRRSYIACNTKDWSVDVNANTITMDQDFLWNYEQGKKIIYSSNIKRVDQSNPTEIDISLPLWSIKNQSVIVNDKPYQPCGEIVHDYEGNDEELLTDKIVAEGTITCPLIVFSNKMENGFGVYVEVYATVGGNVIPIWSTTINLDDINNYKRAKYKNKEYYVWDSCLGCSFDINKTIESTMLAAEGFGLGISVKVISTNDAFIGQKEDMNASIFKLSNFHYTLRFSDR